MRGSVSGSRRHDPTPLDFRRDLLRRGRRGGGRSIASGADFAVLAAHSIRAFSRLIQSATSAGPGGKRPVKGVCIESASLTTSRDGAAAKIAAKCCVVRL